MSPNVALALKTWRSLVASISSLTEDEIDEALKAESQGRNRADVLRRLVVRAAQLQKISAAKTYRRYLNGNCKQQVKAGESPQRRPNGGAVTQGSAAGSETSEEGSREG